MEKQSRRSFIKRTSLGAAVLTSATGLVAAACAPATQAATQTETNKVVVEKLSLSQLDGPVVAYLGNIDKGEVTLLVGSQEYTYSDPELVNRLLVAAVR